MRISGPPLFKRTRSPCRNRSIGRSPVMERREPAHRGPGPHTRRPRVLPVLPVLIPGYHAWRASPPASGSMVGRRKRHTKGAVYACPAPSECTTRGAERCPVLQARKPMRTTRHPCHGTMCSRAPAKPCVLATCLSRFLLLIASGASRARRWGACIVYALHGRRRHDGGVSRAAHSPRRRRSL